MSEDPRIPAVFRHESRPAATVPVVDPLRLCVATTVAVIAWIITPAATVTVMGSLGIRAYVRARRAGLLASRCLLGDTRLVLAYLTLVVTGGAVATAIRVASLVS